MIKVLLHSPSNIGTTPKVHVLLEDLDKIFNRDQLIERQLLNYKTMFNTQIWLQKYPTFGNEVFFPRLVCTTKVVC